MIFHALRYRCLKIENYVINWERQLKDGTCTSNLPVNVTGTMEVGYVNIPTREFVKKVDIQIPCAEKKVVNSIECKK